MKYKRKEWMSELGKLLLNGFPRVHYSLCEEYTILVSFCIFSMGILIICDSIFGKGCLLGNTSLTYEVFVSDAYIRLMVPLGMVSLLFRYMFQLNFMRMLSVMFDSIFLLTIVSGAAKGQGWRWILLSAFLCCLLLKGWNFLEGRANRRGYSILYPGQWEV